MPTSERLRNAVLAAIPYFQKHEAWSPYSAEVQEIEAAITASAPDPEWWKDRRQVWLVAQYAYSRGEDFEIIAQILTEPHSFGMAHDKALEAAQSFRVSDVSL
jgi:hypothetical protein